MSLPNISRQVPRHQLVFENQAMSFKEEDPAAFSVNLIRKLDGGAKKVIDKAKDVKLFRYDTGNEKWVSTETEGTLVFYQRLDDPPFGLVLLGRDPAHSWNQTFGPGVEIQSRSPFLLYRSLDGSTGSLIEGLWFPSREECEVMYNQVQTSTTQSSFPSYAAMVTGPVKMEENNAEGSKKRNILVGLGENELKERTKAAEQAARVLHSKAPACDFCGKTNHPSHRCYKKNGRPEQPQQGKVFINSNGLGSKPINIAKRDQANSATSRYQPNQNQNQPSVLSPPNYTDSAIVESKSTSSSSGTARLPDAANYSREGSSTFTPINLTSVLRHDTVPPQPYLMPPILNQPNPFLDMGVASNHLRGLLNLGGGIQPRQPETPEHASIPTNNSVNNPLTLSASSVTNMAEHGEENVQRFMRDVSEKLNASTTGVVDSRFVGGSGSAMSGDARRSSAQSQMSLRPPHHFENVIGGMQEMGPLLLPQHMDGMVANRRMENGMQGRDVVAMHPLTKEQLLQAMEYLMRTDREFVGRLHEAYIKSMMEHLRL